jgi:hypothetical protein
MKFSNVDLKNWGSVSSGTLNTFDLMGSFLPMLANIDKKRHDIFVSSWYNDGWRGEGGQWSIVDNERVYWVRPNYPLDYSGHKFWDNELAEEMLNELFDAINEYVPNGYYFGSHPGDGADFGFWQTEE